MASPDETDGAKSVDRVTVGLSGVLRECSQRCRTDLILKSGRIHFKIVYKISRLTCDTDNDTILMAGRDNGCVSCILSLYLCLYRLGLSQFTYRSKVYSIVRIYRTTILTMNHDGH